MVNIGLVIVTCAFALLINNKLRISNATIKFEFLEYRIAFSMTLLITMGL